MVFEEIKGISEEQIQDLDSVKYKVMRAEEEMLYVHYTNSALISKNQYLSVRNNKVKLRNS